MNKIARNLVVLVAFAMTLTGLALAQDSSYHVIADIPFDFFVGQQSLPAGSYSFAVNYGNHSVTLRNHATGRTYELLARPSDGDRLTQAVVEFDVIAGKHLLADLKTTSSGVDFPEQKVTVATGHRGSVAILATLR
jgi:hypothetical protein